MLIKQSMQPKTRSIFYRANSYLKNDIFKISRIRGKEKEGSIGGRWGEMENLQTTA